MENYKKIVGVLIGFFVILLTYHLVLYLTYAGEETVFNRWIVPLMALIMLYGSFFGLMGVKKMGLDNAQSKGLFFASGGIFFLGLGFVSWAYYAIVQGNDLPFPSVADYFWVIYTVLVIIAFFYFFKIFKGSINYQKIIIATILLAITGYFMIKLVGLPVWGAEEGGGEYSYYNEAFFNFFYSISDLIIIAMSIIILTVAGGKIYSGLFAYNLGLIFMVGADLTFALRDEAEIYWQGDISDVLFSTAGFLFSLGLIMFVKKLSENPASNSITENTL